MSSPEKAPDSKNEAEVKAQFKDNSRDGRLSFRTLVDHQLRKHYKEIVIKQKCESEISTFANCANDNGIMVVFRCRDFMKKLNECMAYHNTDEMFEKFKSMNPEEFEGKYDAWKG